MKGLRVNSNGRIWLKVHSGFRAVKLRSTHSAESLSPRVFGSLLRSAETDLGFEYAALSVKPDFYRLAMMDVASTQGGDGDR